MKKITISLSVADRNLLVRLMEGSNISVPARDKAIKRMFGLSPKQISTILCLTV